MVGRRGGMRPRAMVERDVPRAGSDVGDDAVVEGTGPLTGMCSRVATVLSLSLASPLPIDLHRTSAIPAVTPSQLPPLHASIAHTTCARGPFSPPAGPRAPVCEAAPRKGNGGGGAARGTAGRADGSAAAVFGEAAAAAADMEAPGGKFLHREVVTARYSDFCPGRCGVLASPTPTVTLTVSRSRWAS